MRIFNSMTRTKQEFVPVHPGEARIYACGPTVYNYFHIGNARPFIVFDTLRRYLEYRGYKVTFVQNFTDVDDKMINNAAEQGITVKELGEKFIKEYFVDAKGLNIKPATVHPRATQHIKEIIDLIQKLIDNGHAYVAENGDVYYDTESFKGYGKLSGQRLQDLEMGARIEVNDIKKNPMDFALWKAKKPGEISWDSPFSEGRPGWHIECSAMSMKYLGEEIDIHGGGEDLKFPHHENEIAQSEGATGKQFAKYWMHNGFIKVNNEKMSKSLGNFFTVRDISQKYDLLAVRLFMLSSQYRNPINFSDDLIKQADTALERINNCRALLKYVAGLGRSGESYDLSDSRQKFIDAMDDDLNTADAIGVIFDLVTKANTAFSENGDSESAAKTLSLLDELLDVLGLIRDEDDSIPEEIQKLVDERTEARKNRDWAKADSLRDLIKEKGYELKDSKDGVQIIKI
ncbi:MAG: cysteine--tRNA ligase [Clostridia bacterium]|nr:cysteine--tRNA ligase [Clostridia bacterium]